MGVDKVNYAEDCSICKHQLFKCVCEKPLTLEERIEKLEERVEELENQQSEIRDNLDLNGIY